jgi:signal transduction histidine kinase
MPEAEQDVRYFMITSTLIAVIFVAIIVLFILFYRNRRLHFLRQHENITKALHNELLHARAEVQEQTLQHISRDLHDNIGQKLSVARIYINKLESEKTDSAEKQELGNISALLGEAIHELRGIVNSLSTDSIHSAGLVQALERETGIINQLNLVQCGVRVTGDYSDLFTPQQELLLFRICQEFIQNSIKHARCTRIDVELDFDHHPFRMRMTDNGTGFDAEAAKNSASGNGLKNMINRARILGGELTISSRPGHTEMILLLPVQKT